MPQDAAIGPIQLKPAQRRVLAALAADGTSDLTRARYEEIAGVSRSQAAYDLADLVEAGVLERIGNGRATRYRVVGEGRSGNGTHRRWTNDRIRSELEAFCAGRQMWPSAAEFKSAGHGDLYVAASRYGGIPHWASELGFPRSAPGPPAPPATATALPRRPRLRAKLAWAGAGALGALGLAAAAAAGFVVLARQPGPAQRNADGASAARLSDESIHPLRTVQVERKHAKARHRRVVRAAKRATPTRRASTPAQASLVTYSNAQASQPASTVSSGATTNSTPSSTADNSAGPSPLPAPASGSAPTPLEAP